MKCISCENLSWTVLCKNCKKLIKPHLSKREIKDDFFAYSFFAYNDIAPLLHTKHHACGVYVYDFLAKISFKEFFKEFHFDEKLCLVPIDDRIKGGYSHTAVLVNAIKSKNLKPCYNVLRAKNKISYSGKSLTYRKKNPRNFTCKNKNLQNVILVDDLVTSGITLLEAVNTMKKSNINVLFALTLADAKVK